MSTARPVQARRAYDTLLDDLDRGAPVGGRTRARARRRQRHPRGLLFVAIATPLALIFASGMARTIARRQGAEPGQPAFLPAFALAIAVTSFAIGVAGNQLSRAVEARADTFSLELTEDPRA
jgi:Zn-dependent protease with chaperone function